MPEPIWPQANSREHVQPVSTEEVLLGEREVIATWLDALEKGLAQGHGRYERVLQLRRLLGKLDSRIRLVRDLDGKRHWIQGKESTWKSV